MCEGPRYRQRAILVDMARCDGSQEETGKDEESAGQEKGRGRPGHPDEGDGQKPGESQALGSEGGLHAFTMDCTDIPELLQASRSSDPRAGFTGPGDRTLESHIRGDTGGYFRDLRGCPEGCSFDDL